MPSSINFQGRTVYRPGTYGQANAVAAGGTGLSVGNVCVIGKFPFIEKGVLSKKSDAEDLLALDPKNLELALIADYGFNPLSTGARPTSISLLNIQPNTQAALSIGSGVSVKSAYWGSRGNRMFLSIANNGSLDTAGTSSMPGMNIKLTDSGTGEVSSDISVDLVKLGVLKGKAAFNGPGNTLTASLTSAGQFTIAFQRTQAVSNAGTTMNLAIQSCSLQAPDGDAVYTITVVGKDKSGNALTEVLTIPDGGSTTELGDTFSFITSLTSTINGANCVLSGNIIDVDANTYDSFNSLLALLASAEYSEVLDGFSVLVESNFKVEDLDLFTAADLTDGNSLKLTANKALLVKALNAAGLPMLASKASAAYDYSIPAVGTIQTLSFTGGSESSAASGDWKAGFDGLFHQNVQILCAYTDDISIQLLLKQSLKDSIAAGGMEKNAWVGSSAGQTIDAISGNWINALNDRNFAVVGQQVKVNNPFTGALLTKDPMFLALMLACGQAALGPAIPLTRKEIRIVDTVQVWSREQDIEKAIKKSLVVISSLGNNPLRVERSVTTYRIDDNAIFSEVSANDSVNTSLRDVRLSVDSLIGGVANENSLASVKGIIETRLTLQRTLGYIKNFKDVKVRQSGDTFLASYSLAATEPLNFVIVTANVGRF
jgi:hypothetical protein